MAGCSWRAGKGGRRRWAVLLFAPLAFSACLRPAATPPSWPPDLIEGVSRIRIQRWRGEEPARAATLVRGPAGPWMIESPRRGEADPDGITRLMVSLQSPRLISAAPIGRIRANMARAFLLELGPRQVTIFQAPLGREVPVRISGVGDFLVDPTEIATKVPDPDELLPPGLWVSAQGKLTSVEVAGKSAGLNEVGGLITDRMAADHPELGPPGDFGLEKPAATVRACAGRDCREFKFGSVERQGRRRYFAQGPGADPIELRDNDWKLLPL